MKHSESIKKASYNLWFGIVGQIITTIVAIVVPRLFVVSFGSEINGFVNSINQLFVYVALLEAGVGTASLQALYIPAGEKDTKSMNAILAATHYFYKRTGVIYFLVICGLAFLYPLFITTDLKYATMVLIILLTGGGGALPYFSQAKYKILLQAEGKNYIITNINTINQILLSLGKVLFLLRGADVLQVQAIYLVLNLLQAAFYERYIHKKYKWIDLKVSPNYEAISQKNSVLIHQISSLVFNNTDVLILTFMCDLTSVSIYTMYKYVLSMLSSVLNNLTGSFTFRLGQIYGNKNKFLRWYNIYEGVHIALIYGCFTVAYLFITPFMQLYTAGMDANYVLTYMPILAISVEVFNLLRIPAGNVITFAGRFKDTQWRAVLEAIINVVVSIVGVHYCGIYGVMLGTIAALAYRTNDIIIYANKRLLERGLIHTFKYIVIDTVCSLGGIYLFNMLGIQITNYVVLVFYAAVVAMVIVPIHLLINTLITQDLREFAMSIARRISKKIR